ncbi:heme-binding protein [Pseudomonas sp. NW5]|uniref:GlcG/HbpS family heme-binding protein n=1 Tax=Pseudomonas sp. NW5 TaxID=2934934 RepID=UPI00202068C3|nr:heme-binding protein [Pseudomonas sp. NW5]MCL7462368.1 heme-binding protein [Pseudomonas sp. NW5]
MLRQQATLSLELARIALSAVLEEAACLQVQISVSIVDAAGQLIHLAHMDGAPALSRDIALDKAYTAASFGLSTGRWEAQLAEAPASVRDGLAHRPRMVLFGGGEPVRTSGQVVGAIGVSGASAEQDEQCAHAGVQAVMAALASA